MPFYPDRCPATAQLCKFESILEIGQFKVKTSG